MKQIMKFSALSLAVFFISLAAIAQNPFGEISFVKVKPGMTESYLIDMKTTKKINNGLKANKTINSFCLLKKIRINIIKIKNIRIFKNCNINL